LLRVFVPLRTSATDAKAPITGYFEGVRVVPSWQQDQIFSDSLTMALMVGLASLACGAVLYPVVVHLSADNARKAREVLESHIAMMEALGRAIAKRDSDTGAHNYRVAWIAARIGEELGLKGSDMQALIVGSFLHDVGKIGIPDAILLKPGRLDDTEMATMRTHVAQGESMVDGIGWPGPMPWWRPTTKSGMARATRAAWRPMPSRWRPASLRWPTCLMRFVRNAPTRSPWALTRPWPFWTTTRAAISTPV
jgi:hypothetical protein